MTFSGYRCSEPAKPSGSAKPVPASPPRPPPLWVFCGFGIDHAIAGARGGSVAHQLEIAGHLIGGAAQPPPQLFAADPAVLRRDLLQRVPQLAIFVVTAVVGGFGRVD